MATPKAIIPAMKNRANEDVSRRKCVEAFVG